MADNPNNNKPGATGSNSGGGGGASGGGAPPPKVSAAVAAAAAASTPSSTSTGVGGVGNNNNAAAAATKKAAPSATATPTPTTSASTTGKPPSTKPPTSSSSSAKDITAAVGKPITGKNSTSTLLVPTKSSTSEGNKVGSSKATATTITASGTIKPKVDAKKTAGASMSGKVAAPTSTTASNAPSATTNNNSNKPKPTSSTSVMAGMFQKKGQVTISPPRTTTTSASATKPSANAGKPSATSGTAKAGTAAAGKNKGGDAKKSTGGEKPKKTTKSKKKKTSVDGPTMAEVLKKKGKKKKEKSKDGKSTSTTNPGRKQPKLPTAASKKKSASKTSASQQSNNTTPSSSTPRPGYSAQQAAVNDMMRRALEEDQYSALGSVVDTDSSDDENGYAEVGEGGSIRWNHRPKRGSSGGVDDVNDPTDNANNDKPWMGNTKLDRQSLMTAMRKHLRMEGMKSVRNFDGNIFLEDAEEYIEKGNGKRTRSLSLEDVQEEGLAVDGRKIGKRRKKKKKGKHGTGGDLSESGLSSGADMPMSASEVGDDWEDVAPAAGGGAGAASATAAEPSAGFEDDGDFVGEQEESSIFGQTTGASNATWVECDRCKKWRRLRGVVDARKLPSRWYCSMNKTDPERARCSAPEEEYESSTTPESAMDQRTRKHLRVWVRRLHCNEAYENRQRSSKKRAAAVSGSMTSKEPYEWIRCCNPSCGKWRSLLRSMDAASVIEKCRRGEWYCVMNTWDEKAASCGAAQENLPSVGCPPWVLVDT